MIEKAPPCDMRNKCYLDKHGDGLESVKAASIGSSTVSMMPSLAPSSVSSLISSFTPSQGFDKENRQQRLQRSNTNDFNTMRMANLVRERNLDSQAYYKRVSFLPLKIRQVTFLNEELGGYSNTKSTMGMPGRGKTGVHLNTDQWKKDIDRQVHSWMKTKPVHENQRVSPRQMMSPTFDGTRKRRQKRHRLRDAEENMETTESVTGGSESLVSVSTDYTKQSSTDTKTSQTSMLSKTNSHTKDRKFSRSSDDLLDTPERVGKQHAYNEIEYQKRYRRIYDLKKHLHFVNSTCLSGQNILKKNQRLPPMNGLTKEEVDLTAPDLLAITSVQKHNEPESVVRYPPPTLVTTTQLTTHISPTKDFEDNQQYSNIINHKNQSANTPETTQWQHTNRKPELNVYDKLPRITGKGQKRPGAEQQLTISDYRVLRENEIRNRRNKRNGSNFPGNRKHSVIEEADSTCNTHRTDYEGGAEASEEGEIPGFHGHEAEPDTDEKAREEDDENEEDQTTDQYEQTPGMKIRIHIKYKRDLDDAREDSTDTEDTMNTASPSHRGEGRLPLKHRTHNKKKSVRQVSE
ncbi:uncharacterized protein LOC110445387 isoform X2 [Mizuhopecten yessoensis]|uniref:Uncharacterized protein n=1 Tax=Mizuhopecten yessoensis TaxID=6573 RepID=A0A210QZP7_MIZYE|nr:uncharacterized protein LOC110445387 isoform X2 [Mizuhopecten yessoensis]OWF54243.1 hypothetical protein KP79_PYT10916 [Mizuhopecten yessoensis]